MQHRPSPRVLKVGEEMKRVLSLYFQQGEFHNAALSTYIVVVAEVRMSSDLKVAKVYVTTLGAAPGADFFKLLNHEKTFVRRYVAGQMHLKYVPELIFKDDTVVRQSSHIDALLHLPNVRRDLETHDD